MSSCPNRFLIERENSPFPHCAFTSFPGTCGPKPNGPGRSWESQGIEPVQSFDVTDLKELELFSNECRKTKTKVITLANQKGRRQSSKPIKTRTNYTYT